MTRDAKRPYTRETPARSGLDRTTAMPKLLIADDSMFQRFQAAKVAKECGFDVVEATDGEECLRQAKKHRPKAILLDLNMPGPGGLAVMELLSRELPEIRIVVVTADIQETTRGRCMELGAQYFLNKPVDPAALRQTLETLL
jgi:two-component system, chemotaxis family, chemotaxis protein CheY